jgi:hypothetical protein
MTEPYADPEITSPVFVVGHWSFTTHHWHTCKEFPGRDAAERYYAANAGEDQAARSAVEMWREDRTASPVRVQIIHRSAAVQRDLAFKARVPDAGVRGTLTSTAGHDEETAR